MIQVIGGDCNAKLVVRGLAYRGRKRDYEQSVSKDKVVNLEEQFLYMIEKRGLQISNIEYKKIGKMKIALYVACAHMVIIW